MDAERRLSTGIHGLDDLIEGGLKPHSINLVMGEAGCGKSTFATHFLKAGADVGEAGLYVSVEEAKDKFFNNIRNFLDQGVITFEQYLQGDVKRVVLDSVTALMLAYSNETSQRNALLMLFDLLERRGATVLVTSEVEAGAGDGRFGIGYLVDGIFRLYYRKIGQERVRTLEIMKMRGTDHSKQEMVYRLGKTGIILYPNEKVLI
jgi:circadian clock protein KaiC